MKETKVNCSERFKSTSNPTGKRITPACRRLLLLHSQVGCRLIFDASVNAWRALRQTSTRITLVARGRGAWRDRWLHRGFGDISFGRDVAERDREQAEVPIGATSFERTVATTPTQPAGIRCGLCVLVETQRISDREMGSRRTHKFAKAELSRCRAKWACALMLNPPLTPQRGPIAEAKELAADEASYPDDGGKCERHPEGAGVPAAQKRPSSEPSGGGRKSAEAKRRRHEDQVLGEIAAHSHARAGGAGIPVQELSVGRGGVPRMGHQVSCIGMNTCNGFAVTRAPKSQDKPARDEQPG